MPLTLNCLVMAILYGQPEPLSSWKASKPAWRGGRFALSPGSYLASSSLAVQAWVMCNFPKPVCASESQGLCLPWRLARGLSKTLYKAPSSRAGASTGLAYQMTAIYFPLRHPPKSPIYEIRERGSIKLCNRQSIALLLPLVSWQCFLS